MSFRRIPCPSCNVILRVTDSTPDDAALGCPKCGQCFRVPPPAEDPDQAITSAAVPTVPRARRSSASAATDGEGMLRTIRHRAPPSRLRLWLLLGSLAAGLVLFVVAAGIGLAVWLSRSVTPSSPTPQVRFVPPEFAPAPQDGTAERWFTLGNQLMQQGDLEGAINAFTSAIELNPRHAAAYFNRGMARNQKGDYDGAIADFDKDVALLPTFEFAYIQRGKTWSKKKNWPKAEADFTRALKLNPTNPLAYRHRGISRMKQGQRASAIADFRAALQFNPLDVKILLCAGDGDGALAAAERLVTLHPHSSGALVCRAFIHAWRGEDDKALADYAAALNVNPNYVEVYLLRGWFYLSLGREDEAAQEADTGLKRGGRKHRQTPYLAILANCARRRQHPDEARRAAEALSKQGDKSWPRPVLRYLHDAMSAEELLRTAADDNQRTEAHAYLGVVLWLSGADEKAREHLEWAHDNGPDDFIEYDLAVLLLHRLDKKPEQKP